MSWWPCRQACTVSGYFFFQAEDGIRDVAVTGVQTCALPIYIDDLNLAAAGLDADARGRISVDEQYRTKQLHIFAVGDVIGFPSLGSVSMEQGRIAAASAFGMPVHSNRANYPYGIYSIPEIGRAHV